MIEEKQLWIERAAAAANRSAASTEDAVTEPIPAEGAHAGEVDPFAPSYPAQCRLYNYKTEFLPAIGCTCDASGCTLKTDASAPYMGCASKQGLTCFGRDKVKCHPVAKTQTPSTNICHSTCKTCSPGQDEDGTTSQNACRSCQPHRAWVPAAGKVPTKCTMGQQQGACIAYPSPARRCKTACSPSTLTTDHKPRVIRIVNTSTSNSTSYIKEEDIPTLACAKVCTDSYVLDLEVVAKSSQTTRDQNGAPENGTSSGENNTVEPNSTVAGPTRMTPDGVVAFGPTLSLKNDTLIFCTAYKLVSCKWKPDTVTQSEKIDIAGGGPLGTWETSWGPTPSNNLGGKYVCNERKHVKYVGFQLHGDEDKAYNPKKTFFAVNSTFARSVVGLWMYDKAFNTSRASVNRTIFPNVEPHIRYGKPPDDVQVSNLYDFLMMHSSSLCFKHALLV